jgi:hypothetical protein
MIIMSASLIRARSTRVRNPPQMYTPNRQNPDNNHKMSYKINTKRLVQVRALAGQLAWNPMQTDLTSTSSMYTTDI